MHRHPEIERLINISFEIGEFEAKSIESHCGHETERTMAAQERHSILNVAFTRRNDVVLVVRESRQKALTAAMPVSRLRVKAVAETT